MKKHPFSNRCVGLILFLSAVLILSATPLFAAEQRIQNGTGVGAIRVAVQDLGQMAVWRCGGTTCNPVLTNVGGWTQETYGPFSKGSIVFLGAGTTARFSSNATNMSATPAFTTVSNTTTGTDTITTVYMADGGNVRITQTTSIAVGDSYYKMRWDIENIGSSTYDNVRFVHGEDTYLDGVDGGVGHFDSSLQMVYVSSVVLGSANMMGLYADPSTPFSVYFEGIYSTNFTNMRSWTMNNTVNATNHDAAYSLGWTRGSVLAPGETWSIIAYEQFMSAQGILVLAPAGGSGEPGDIISYPFVVQNLDTASATISLTAASEHGWAYTIEDGAGIPITSVTLAGSAQTTVHVRVTIPAAAVNGDTDRITLTGTKPVTGGTATGSNSTTTTVTIPLPPLVIAPPGGLGEPGDTISYPFVVQSQGGDSTVTLSAVSAGGWTFAIQDCALNTPLSSIYLAFGAPETVCVRVTIPAAAVNGDTDLVTLTATKSSSSSGSGSTTTTVFVPLPLSSNIVVTAPAGVTGSPGDTISYPFVIQNLDSRPATINLSVAAVSGSSWTVSIQDGMGYPITSIGLAGGASGTVYVLVTIPAGAVDGATDPLTLTASVVGAPTISSSGSTTTTVLDTSTPVIPPRPASKSGDLRGNGGCSVIGRNGYDGQSVGLTALYLAMIFAPVALLRWRRVGAKKRGCGANKAALLVLLVAAALMVASSAQAMGIMAVKAQRFHPALDDFGALTAESDKTLGFGEVVLGVHLNVSHEALNTGDVHGPIDEVLVKDLYTANLTAAYGIAPNIQLGIDVPFNATFSNMNAVTGDREHNFSTGDIRISGKFRVFSHEDFGVALIPFINLTTGNKDLYLSEGKGGYGLKVASHLNVTKDLTLYVNAGVELLGNAMTTSSPDYHAKWMQYAVGASYGFKGGKHKIIAEVNTETSISRPYGHEWRSPVEMLAAVRSEIKPGLSVQVGGGTGLNNGMGAPLWRVFSGVYYRF